MHGLGVGFHHAIDDAELRHPRTGLRGARGDDDFAGEALRARGARDRTADQAEADQRDPPEKGAVVISAP